MSNKYILVNKDNKYFSKDGKWTTDIYRAEKRSGIVWGHLHEGERLVQVVKNRIIKKRSKKSMKKVELRNRLIRTFDVFALDSCGIPLRDGTYFNMAKNGFEYCNF